MLKSLSELFKTKESSYGVKNVTHLFTDQELGNIAQDVLYDYNQDLTTCKEKFDQLKEIMALAMIVAEAKSYPWPNASNIIYPLIANAAINFGASCYPEIIQDDEIVKAKIIGKDNGKVSVFNGQKQTDPKTGELVREGAGNKLKRGTRVATMMNWQLTEQMTWWESDVDKEVHTLPIVGTLYKKVYYDTLKKMPVSELIFPDKIVINNSARDIDSAVVTQLIELYPQEILQRIRSGFYRDFDFDLDDMQNAAPQADATTTSTIPQLKPDVTVESNTNLHKFLEQHTWLDLDEDGFLEPYIVTVHYESNQVVRIIPRFEEKDISYNEKKEVKEIKACKYYVVRRFLPSFDGGFMGIGFGHLLKTINDSINTNLNQLTDAGTLANTGGGLIDNRIKTRGGKLTISMNEYRLINTNGVDLQSGIFSFPKTEPSSVLFTLLEFLTNAGKELGSMRDVLNGVGAPNMPATTYMGMVDQAHKEFKSVFKRLHKSFKIEFGLLYDINSKNLSNEEYAKVLDEDEDMVNVKGDFDGRDFDIVPVADVNSIVSSQKFAQATFLTGFIGNQNVEQTKLLKNVFHIARIPDTDEMIIPAPAQVDPAIQIAQMDQQVKMASLQVAAEKNALETQKLQLEIPKLAAEVEKIRSSIMVDFANVGKISQEVDLNKQEQEIKIASHLVDAEVEQIKAGANIHVAKIREKTELLKLTHDHVQRHQDRVHEKDLSKQEVAKAAD